jgi:hypothetical protein
MDMDLNLAALIAAVAASVGVFAHGVVGGRWLAAQLGSVDMRPTQLSTRLFGDDDVSRQVFGVTWHSVSAVFLASAVALYLTAFGALESRDLLRFIAILHAAILGVGLFYIEVRPAAIAQPIPLTFMFAMVTAAGGAWIASTSL